MLKIFICPKCYNYRIVSRKPHAICFHCGARLHYSDIEYAEYVDMSVEERASYKEKFMSRMRAYQENLDDVFTEKKMNDNEQQS